MNYKHYAYLYLRNHDISLLCYIIQVMKVLRGVKVQSYKFLVYQVFYLSLLVGEHEL